MAVVQTLFFSALAPLLPQFERDLGISKGQAGLLVGMFPMGLGLASLPMGMLAARIGVKRGAIAGVAGLAFASAAFGLVDGYGWLLATRFLQGVVGALCWSSAIAWLVGVAPASRRGEMIGITSGAMAAGQVLGAAFGALAVLEGRSWVFTGVGVFALLVASVGTKFPGPAAVGRQPLSFVRGAHGSRTVVGGHLLIVLTGLLLGTNFVLAPLRLDRQGWGPIGIAGTFLTAAALGVLVRPVIGRWADRLGHVRAVRLLMLVPIPVTFAIPWVTERWLLSVCVVVAMSSYGFLNGPSMALVSHGYENAGVSQSLGFSLIALTSGSAFFIGSTVGGDVAHLAGDVAAYSLVGAASAAAFVALSLRRGARATSAQAGTGLNTSLP